MLSSISARKTVMVLVLQSKHQLILKATRNLTSKLERFAASSTAGTRLSRAYPAVFREVRPLRCRRADRGRYRRVRFAIPPPYASPAASSLSILVLVFILVASTPGGGLLDVVRRSWYSDGLLNFHAHAGGHSPQYLQVNDDVICFLP